VECANAFFDVIDVTGLLFSIFYILTALAAVAYYRRRIGSGAVDFVTVGLLPLGAAGFLGWIFVKSLGEAPWSQRWSLIGVLIAGLVVPCAACNGTGFEPERHRGRFQGSARFDNGAVRYGVPEVGRRESEEPGDQGLHRPYDICRGSREKRRYG
jgi:hypothetical protein